MRILHYIWGAVVEWQDAFTTQTPALWLDVFEGEREFDPHLPRRLKRSARLSHCVAGNAAPPMYCSVRVSSHVSRSPRSTRALRVAIEERLLRHHQLFLAFLCPFPSASPPLACACASLCALCALPSWLLSCCTLLILLLFPFHSAPGTLPLSTLHLSLSHYPSLSVRHPLFFSPSLHMPLSPLESLSCALHTPAYLYLSVGRPP